MLKGSFPMKWTTLKFMAPICSCPDYIAVGFNYFVCSKTYSSSIQGLPLLVFTALVSSSVSSAPANTFNAFAPFNDATANFNSQNNGFETKVLKKNLSEHRGPQIIVELTPKSSNIMCRKLFPIQCQWNLFVSADDKNLSQAIFSSSSIFFDKYTNTQILFK